MAKPASKPSPRGSTWDSEENEAKNNFVGFNSIGDFVYGALLSAKQVPSTLPDKKGELQWIYTVKVYECEYHVLDAKKRVVDESIVVEAGEIISVVREPVGGRSMIDSRMERVKVGQVFGLKFTEELEPKTRGYNPTKVIKVFTPKDRAGGFEMDAEVEAAHAGKQAVDEFDKAE